MTFYLLYSSFKNNAKMTTTKQIWFSYHACLGYRDNNINTVITSACSVNVLWCTEFFVVMGLNYLDLAVRWNHKT